MKATILPLPRLSDKFCTKRGEKLPDGAALSNGHFHDENVGKNLKMIPVAVENSPKTPFPG